MYLNELLNNVQILNKMTDSVRVVVRFRRDKEGEEVDDWEFDQEIKRISLREKKFFS